MQGLAGCAAPLRLYHLPFKSTVYQDELEFIHDVDVDNAHRALHDERNNNRYIKSTLYMEKLGNVWSWINLITACITLAGGEGEDVVRGEHLGQTKIVCHYRRNDANVTSDLGNVDLLGKEACIVIVE